MTVSGCCGRGVVRSGGSALLFVAFSVLASILLHSLSTSAVEQGGPLHLAHGGVMSPGILFMTWRAQGVMNGCYLCSCSRCAFTRHLEQ